MLLLFQERAVPIVQRLAALSRLFFRDFWSAGPSYSPTKIEEDPGSIESATREMSRQNPQSVCQADKNDAAQAKLIGQRPQKSLEGIHRNRRIIGCARLSALDSDCWMGRTSTISHGTVIGGCLHSAFPLTRTLRVWPDGEKAGSVFAKRAARPYGNNRNRRSRP